MAELTLNELASKTGKTIASVRKSVVRGKLVKSGRGRIDDAHPTNVEFITKVNPEYYQKIPQPTKVSADKTKLATKLQQQIDRELEQDVAQLDLEAMGEQELKEQLLRERIVSTEVERKYKVKQTMLSDTKRRKMEGDLIDTEWVVATLGHGLAMYKREIKDGIDTLLSTIFSEHGITGDDKTRYTESFIDVLAIAHKDYEYRLTKQVEAYSPDKMEGAE